MPIKKILCYILFLPLLICGCAANTQNNDITFYYLNAGQPYYSEDGMLGTEIRKVPLDSLDYAGIMKLYFAGPMSKNLKTPFPDGIQLVDISIEQNTVNILLNNAMTSLSGVDLSLACTCICLTARNITGCTKVAISVQSGLLDGKESITLDANTLHITDQ